MKINFVTLFNKNYLIQGLLLIDSINNFCKKYHCIWIVCVDDETYHFLNLNLPNLNLIKIKSIETYYPELDSIKESRTIAEYCWTLTPFVLDYVCKTARENDITIYLDADTYFFQSPEKLIQDFYNSNSSVLITRHDYDHRFDKSLQAGIYCVQFLAFKPQVSSVVLDLWKVQCFDWCYARYEEGKFGDQKYLDDWPTRFEGLVSVYEPKGHFLAPWNSLIYTSDSCILFHFHGLKFYNDYYFLGYYPISSDMKINIYKIYNNNYIKIKRKYKLNFNKSRLALLTTFKYNIIGSIWRMIKCPFCADLRLFPQKL